MRKLTHRLMNRNGFYKSHLFQFLWLIALLIFVQQLGKSQDSLYLQSPCLCKNDQSANGAKDGSFTDTVIVKGMNATSDTFQVVELTKLAATGIDPIPMWQSGFGNFTPLGDSLYALVIMHFDSAGYKIIVEGPNPIGTGGNTKDSIQNICIYPVIQWNPDVALTYNINDPTVNLGTNEIHGEKGDSTITLNGASASSFTPAALGIGTHKVKATFDGTFRSDTSTQVGMPAYPGCNTEIMNTFTVESDNVMTSLCNCTGATGINTMPFVDTIKLKGFEADSFTIHDVTIFEPSPNIMVVSAFFKENNLAGQPWVVEDTLVKVPGLDTFCFVGYFIGIKDATITFVRHGGANPDTVKVNIPACGDPNTLQIIGPDSICQGNMAMFTLNEMADSISWTFGNKYSHSDTSKFIIPSVDTSGWVTVTAFGSIKGTCIPFNITKQVYVQDTSFEIEGSLFACLNDTIDYSLNLKGATPNYNTITGLKWAVMGGGKIIGDSVNVLNIKVMWDAMVKPHMVLVNGVTTDSCVISDTITVQVDSILQAQIAGPDTVCLGDVHGYKALVAKIDTLLWTTLPADAGKVAEISEDSVNIQWLKVGTHQIIVSGKANGFACDVVDSTFMVTVMDTSFMITGFDAACQGDSTGFGLRNVDGTPVNLKNLTWQVVRNSSNTSVAPKDTLEIGGNISGVKDSINVKWDSIGSHTVIATGETVHGCEVSETKTVNVRDSIFRIFGDTVICLGTTTPYMVYDANNMAVTNMQIITWTVKKDGIELMKMSDDTINVQWLIPGNFKLIVEGMSDDGCPVNDSIMIKVINPAPLKIDGPSLLCGSRDTMWTLGVSDSFLNMVSWDIIGGTGTFTPDASAVDTFKITGYMFAPGMVVDSMNVVVSGKVGSQCTFAETLPLIIRDTGFPIFGDSIVCNSTDTTLYYVDVPGIDSISWTVTGGVATNTIGTKMDTLAVKWATNGTITVFIRTNDGCDIIDSLNVFVRESSVILGDTAVSEFDTVKYTLKGVTATDTIDFTDLKTITWTKPANGIIISQNVIGDTVCIVFSTNLMGEPFYQDTISVVFMTDDGCMDTIEQAIQIRETTYGLKGMKLACQSDTFMWNIGFFDEKNLKDLPTTTDIDTFIWSLPGGGTVVSSDGDSALLSFTTVGTFPVRIDGVFNDSCRFTVLDTITVRSNQLALVGDVDGILCEGQALQGFAIEELNGGNATILGTDQFNGIIWAAGADGTIDNGTGTTPFASNPALATEAANATASFLDPPENAQLKAFTSNFLQNSALISGLTNGSSKGMVAGINATFTNALTADTLFVAAVTTAGCTFANVLDIAVHNRIDGASIACNNLVNISLGADCDLIISPDMVLEDPQFDIGEYSVRIEELNGTFISNGRVGPNEIGKQVRVVITHDCSGNSCWGLLLIEDKNIPDLICSADTIECDDSIDPNATHWTWNLPGRYRGFPIPSNAMAFPVSGQTNTYTVTNFELCGNAVLKYTDNADVLSCADGMGKKILRTWTLTNGSNLTVSCIDTINVEKLDIDSIDFRQFIPHQAYDCSQESSILKENGYPDEAITGNLDALKDDQCFQLNAGFTDTSIPLCGNSWKFFRHWTIIDWCTAEDTTILQIIAFEDKTAPVVNRPVVFDNISDDHECTNRFSIRKPDYTDCSEIILVRLELRIVGDPNWTLWAEKDNPNEDFTNITFGTDGHQVEARYILTDACGNVGTSSVSNPIDIKDDITPVAVCDEEVVITLNDDGVAFATIYTFDDGSVDNCGIVKREIRRLSTDCPNDNGESLTFGSLVMFCCADVAVEDVKVELRVTDAAGNSNTCVTIVTVQDNLTKLNVFNIPHDVTVSCGKDLSGLDALYGDPIFLSSACGVKANEVEVVLGFPLDACGKGVITRTWTATGSSGQEASAQQEITVGKSDEVLTLDKITFPMDINITGCLGDLDPETNPDLGVPIYSNVPCSDPISTYTDLIFKHTDGFCAKVIRTWSVVDWCTVDSLDRNNPNTLFFEGIQVIKLTDNVAPTINSGCDDEIVSTNNSSCTGFFSFSATGSDNCPTGVLKWAYEVDFDKDSTVDLTGKSSSFDASLSVGVHSIKWILSDGCENKDSCTKMVTVMDENPPVLTCPAEHTIVFNDQGQGSITVIGLLAGGADDDCSSLSQLSFSFSENAKVESLLFDCNDLAAQSSMIQNVYVTDGSGNVASCEVFLRLSDPGNVCGLNTSSVVLSGTAFTENNYTVDNVDMRLTDLSDRVLDQQMTPVSGEYAFSDVLSDENYTLKPIKNDNYLNGVSTIDLVLIQNHILGLRSFESPYKVIASDVDGSNTVSVIDLIHIRKLILGITDELPIGRSWSFVDANHQFDDVLNPFPYTDIITMMNVGTDYDDIDFVAVKMADVNDNVSLASAQLSENRSISHLTIENRLIKEHTMSSIPFEANVGLNIAGLQMGISFDADAIEFMGVYGNGFNITKEHINEEYLEFGEIVFSWNGVQNIEIAKGDAVFELRFVAQQEMRLGEVVRLNDDYLRSEIYTDIGSGVIEVSEMYLDTREPEHLSDELVLYQNRPNPFDASTEIRFSLPKESVIELDIFDMAGRAVHHHEASYQRGMNKITLDVDILGDGGVYIYQVADGESVVQMKMIYIK